MTITPYALPAFSDFMDLFPYLNTLTGGLFGYFTIAGIWILTYAAAINSGRRKQDALLSSGYLTTITASLLWVMGALNPIALAVPAIITMGALFYNREND
jgi:hypothetical protein